MSAPLELVQQMIRTKEINEAAERWVLGAFAAWYADGSDPTRLAWAFRIPTGERWATTKRNSFLRSAATGLPEYNRGASLKAEIDRFLKVTWPKWRNFAEPPETASSIETFLFYAAATGAPMRLCRRTINRILAGT